MNTTEQFDLLWVSMGLTKQACIDERITTFGYDAPFFAFCETMV